MHSIVTLVLLTIAPVVSAATLTGRVVEETSGSAIVSGELRLYRTGTPGMIAELETGAEGRFSAEGLPEGDYRIELSKPNHLSSTIRARLLDAIPSNLTIRLISCGAISGRVVDVNNKPVSGAKVYALAMGNGALRRDLDPGRSATVDASGRYRLFNLPPGEYLLATNYGASSTQLGSTGSAAAVASLGSGLQIHPTNARPQPVTIASGTNLRNMDFAVLAGSLYSVSGTVQTGATKPGQGRYWLTLVLVDQPYIAVSAAIAGEDGSFQLAGIPSGNYDLLVSGPSNSRSMAGAMLNDDALFARQRVSVFQDVANLALAPAKGRSLSVTLKAQGIPGCAAAGQVSILGTEDWGSMVDQRASVPLNVPQTIPRLAPAKYKISVGGLGETCFVPETTMLDLTSGRESATVVLSVMAAGAIQGTITGAGAASVTLTCLNDPNQPTQVAIANAENRFTFGPLRPGRYRLSAQRPSRTPSVIDVNVTGGAALEVAIPEPSAQ